MGFEKGNTYGNRFSSENQPDKKNSGRKPSLYKQLRKLTGKTVGFELEKEDYYNIIRFLMEQDSDTLEKLIVVTDPATGKKMMNPKTPIWVVSVCSAINADAKYGRTTTVEMVFDRVFGKAVQPVTGDIRNELGTGGLDLSKLTTDELLQYNALLEKMSTNASSPTKGADDGQV